MCCLSERLDALTLASMTAGDPAFVARWWPSLRTFEYYAAYADTEPTDWPDGMGPDELEAAAAAVPEAPAPAP